MTNNDFVVVFQYDVEQAHGRTIERRIQRMFEEQGGVLNSAYEDYGMVDMSFSFSGIPEDARKHVMTALQSAYKSNIKMSGSIYQKFWHMVVDTQGNDKDAIYTNLRKEFHVRNVSTVEEAQYRPHEIVVVFKNQQAAQAQKDAILASVKELGITQVREEVEQRPIFDTYNYKESEKSKFSFK